jgi:hypothetical protein
MEGSMIDLRILEIRELIIQVVTFCRVEDSRVWLLVLPKGCFSNSTI